MEIFILLCLLCYVVFTSAQVNLGSASSFGVLGAGLISNTGPSQVTGNIGTSGTEIIGFSPGVGTFTGNEFTADQTISPFNDARNAYNTIAGFSGVDLTGQDLGGQVLGPGTYHFGSSAELTGALTLSSSSPSASWYFQIGTTLTTATGSFVLLEGTALACNVFWQVGTSATIGTGTQFAGAVLAGASITMVTAASSDGGLFALSGAITLDTNRVEAVACPVSSSKVFSSTPTSGVDGGVPGGASTATQTTGLSLVSTLGSSSTEGGGGGGGPGDVSTTAPAGGSSIISTLPTSTEGGGGGVGTTIDGVFTSGPVGTSLLTLTRGVSSTGPMISSPSTLSAVSLSSSLFPPSSTFPKTEQILYSPASSVFSRVHSSSVEMNLLTTSSLGSSQFPTTSQYTTSYSTSQLSTETLTGPSNKITVSLRSSTGSSILTAALSSILSSQSPSSSLLSFSTTSSSRSITSSYPQPESLSSVQPSTSKRLPSSSYQLALTSSIQSSTSNTTRPSISQTITESYSFSASEISSCQAGIVTTTITDSSLCSNRLLFATTVTKERIHKSTILKTKTEVWYVTVTEGGQGLASSQECSISAASTVYITTEKEKEQIQCSEVYHIQQGGEHGGGGYVDFETSVETSISTASCNLQHYAAASCTLQHYAVATASMVDGGGGDMVIVPSTEMWTPTSTCTLLHLPTGIGTDIFYVADTTCSYVRQCPTQGFGAGKGQAGPGATTWQEEEIIQTAAAVSSACERESANTSTCSTTSLSEKNSTAPIPTQEGVMASSKGARNSLFEAILGYIWVVSFLYILS